MNRAITTRNAATTRRPRVMARPDLAELLLPTIDAVSSRLDPDIRHASEVHQLRVACRRLRVALWALRERVGRTVRAALDRDLRHLARALGEVREWDVIAAQFGSADPLATLIAERRREALHDLRRMLAHRRGERLRRALQHLRRDLSQRRRYRQAPTAALTERVLRQRFRRMQRRLARTSADDVAALHALRLQVKKLRYCLELFAPYLASGSAALLSRLRAAQRSLGAIQDAHQRRVRLGRLAGTVHPTVTGKPPGHARATTVLRTLERLSRPQNSFLDEAPPSRAI